MKNDYCNHEGAERIKNMIINSWANNGYDVNIMLVKAGFTPALRSARTDVRSDMINGLPRKRLSSPVKKPFFDEVQKEPSNSIQAPLKERLYY